MAKQDRKRINRAIALVASVVLAVGLVPVPAIAVGTGDELGGLASEASPAAATPDAVPLTQGDEGTASDEQPAKAESPAFAQSATVDGVTVTVEADAGVFPEGTRLSVESVPSSATEAAIASERGADANVAASYTFDIKVLDADGAELQPADGKSVRVSFKAAEVADPNLDVSVYHVPEGAAGVEELGVDVSGATATAESGGFSYYTVEFTYGELQYVLKGGEKVALADVLAAVGLSGEVTGVEVSDPALFSASNETGEWVVTSHKAFSTDEWMRVAIAGKAYEIKVTDDQRGTCGENLTWTLTGEGNNLTLTISGTGAMSNYDRYTNPGKSPWSGNDSITSVVIEEGVTSVGNYSFDSCTSLANVSIPSSVTSIGIKAFNNCSALKGIDIPASVTNIGIGDNAFSECTSLGSVVFQGAVGSIGDNAFYSCASLKSVVFPGAVGRIGNGAFSECTALGSVVFQGAVGSIENGAFYNCTSLRSVVFQGAVDGIEISAFYGCSSWNDVYCYGTFDQFASFDRSYWGTTDSSNKPTAHYTQYAVTTSSSDENHGSSKIEWTWPNSAQNTTSATLTATPAEGYHFASWTKGGTVASTDNPCSLTATENAVYVANFELDEYDITATADPEAGGTVSGGGTFTYGQKATLTAEANEGYVFDYWSTKDAPNTSLSKSASFKIDVAGTQEYVAHFRQILIEGKDGGRIPDQAYTGDSATPEVRVYLDGVDDALIVGTNYTVDYSDNVNAGTAKITVALTDPWKGTGVATFGITQADLSSATVMVADQVYDGTAFEPVPKVTWNGKRVAQDDYAATYADNVRAGTATVTVTGKRNFKESSKASGTFRIAKRPATVTADSAERVYDGKPLTADGFTSEGLAEGDMVASAKVEGSQTDVGSSSNKVSGAKIVNAAGEDVTDCYDITYKDGTLTVKPGEKGSYEAASGSGSTWTKGSTDPVTLTFKRAAADERTFDLFEGVEVNGKAVPEKDASGKANWTAKKGSLILSLQPSYLETLADGDHTVKALFDDGAGEATFKVAAKPAPTPTTKHIVTFNANGHGSAPAAQTIEDGKAASKPADPAADGWEFGGWFTDGECRQAYDFATPVTSDLTLYAKWTQKAAAGKATSPKTGDAPSLLPVMALLLLSAAALCLALFALSRRKPAHAGKHARR